MNHLGVTNMVNGLQWKGAGDFQKTERKIWKVKDDVAGYAKSSGNLHYVFLRNAGNYAVMDKPEEVNDMVERFVSGKNF